MKSYFLSIPGFTSFIRNAAGTQMEKEPHRLHLGKALRSQSSFLCQVFLTQRHMVETGIFFTLKNISRALVFLAEMTGNETDIFNHVFLSPGRLCKRPIIGKGRPSSAAIEDVEQRRKQIRPTKGRFRATFKTQTHRWRPQHSIAHIV